MEKHLEDFLVQNWSQTELGQTFDIFAEDGLLFMKEKQINVKSTFLNTRISSISMNTIELASLSGRSEPPC